MIVLLFYSCLISSYGICCFFRTGMSAPPIAQLPYLSCSCNYKTFMYKYVKENDSSIFVDREIRFNAKGTPGTPRVKIDVETLCIENFFT